MVQFCKKQLFIERFSGRPLVNSLSFDEVVTSWVERDFEGGVGGCESNEW
jgi:hypothetical protein